MKQFIKIVYICLVVIFIFTAGFIYYLNLDLDNQESTTINEVNINNLADGVYIGNYSEGRFRNTLEITIYNGEITEIKPKQTVIFEKEHVTTALFKRVIEEQKIAVDTISGATATSKAYLKSIENALK